MVVHQATINQKDRGKSTKRKKLEKKIKEVKHQSKFAATTKRNCVVYKSRKRAEDKVESSIIAISTSQSDLMRINVENSNLVSSNFVALFRTCSSSRPHVVGGRNQ